ncbi:MAG: dihydroorotate dehydrogenase electron transfer subunit [Dehalococcoidales bacterium]|nr:dihydroorotate dehydrogenase electron transfer subunit [Dehalococcoidales bacterium]
MQENDIDNITQNNAAHSICSIISNSEVMPGVFLMWLEAADIAKKAKPGQFIMIQCGGNTLFRRPISIHRTEESKLAILYAGLGSGTQWLSKQKEHTPIDILGPLGNGYTVNNDDKNLLLIAGGMGIAPLTFLADAAVSQGKNVTLLLGAQKEEMVFPGNLLPDGIKCIVTTDDGSMGIKGRTTDMLSAYLDEADRVFACGPAPMYRTMYKNNLLMNKPCQISLEVRMACGMGVCYGCTINTRHGLKQVCHDGPVFDFDDILWDELVDI